MPKPMIIPQRYWNSIKGLADWHLGGKRGEYNIDGGVHFLMGHRPNNPIYRLYEELGIPNWKEFLDLDTYMRFYDQASERLLECK